MEKWREFAKFWRYVAGTCLGGACNWITYIALPELMGVSYALSAATGDVLNFFVNFFFHKTWTFKNGTPRVQRQFVLYLVVSVCATLADAGLLSLLEQGELKEYVVARISIKALLALPSYLATRWVFSK